MDKALEKTRELIKMLKEKRPLYQNILDFYGRIFEAQESVKPHFNIGPVEIENELKASQFSEGFPLIDRKDFVLDLPSSVNLFELICHIGKAANEKMKENIQAMEDALAINALNLKEMLKRHYDESHLDELAGEFDVDKPIFKFLIHISIQPSLEANVEQLKNRVDLKNWLRGYCPICGSPPLMSELKGEGQKSYMCSFCGFLWPGERLKCPFCESKDHSKLHYFYEEKKRRIGWICVTTACSTLKQWIPANSVMNHTSF